MIGGWRLFVASLAQLAGHPRALVGVWLWPAVAIAVFYAGLAACSALASPDGIALAAYWFLLFPLIWFCLGWVAVAWHGHVLADLPVVRWPIPQIVTALLYGVVIFGYLHLSDLIPVLTRRALAYLGSANTWLLCAIASVETGLRVGLLYTVLRLSPTLVSAALCNKVEWPGVAWRRTRTIAPAILVCAMIWTGVQILSIFGFSDVRLDGWTAVARMGWPLVLGMIGISVITTIYVTTAPAPD